MTIKQYRKKMAELRRKTAEHLRLFEDAALRSGAFDLPSTADDYALPRAVIVAACRDVTDSWQTHRRYGARQVNNIYRMTYISR